MEVSYKRDLNSQYLVISESGAENSEELAMLLHNHIPGLLDAHIQEVNGESEVCYEITGLTPLSELYRGRKLKKKDISVLLFQFAGAVQEASRYLLRGESLLLDAEYIFAARDRGDIRFCCWPLLEESPDLRINRLCRFILDHIDYEDRECVRLSYDLFQESLKENITIESFISHVAGRESDEEEEEDRETGTEAQEEPEAEEESIPRKPGTGKRGKRRKKKGKAAAAFLSGVSTAAMLAMFAYGILLLCAKLGLLNGDRQNAPVLGAVLLLAAAGTGAFLYLMKKIC